MATTFDKNIKPYFSPGDQAAMSNPRHTHGFTLDLWSKDDVQNNYDVIKSVIDGKTMPPGGWADDQITAFDKDFEAWKAGGFQ